VYFVVSRPELAPEIVDFPNLGCGIVKFVVLLFFSLFKSVFKTFYVPHFLHTAGSCIYQVYSTVLCIT